jgi:hypothetical protein
MSSPNRLSVETAISRLAHDPSTRARCAFEFGVTDVSAQSPNRSERIIDRTIAVPCFAPAADTATIIRDALSAPIKIAQASNPRVVQNSRRRLSIRIRCALSNRDDLAPLPLKTGLGEVKGWDFRVDAASDPSVANAIPEIRPSTSAIKLSTETVGEALRE